jgi:glutamate racemase
MLQRTLGRDVRLVTSGQAIARRVEHALGRRDLANPQEQEGDYRFLCTGNVDAFRELGTRFLQMPLGDIVHVDLEREHATA